MAIYGVASKILIFTTKKKKNLNTVGYHMLHTFITQTFELK